MGLENRNQRAKIVSGLILAAIFSALFAINWSKLPTLDAENDYHKQAALYQDYQKILFVFLVPSLAFLCFGLKTCRLSRQFVQYLLKVFNHLPAVFFWCVLPFGIFVEAAITAKWMLSATPQILDGFNYLFQAKNFALGQFSAPAPPAPELFQFPFIIMENGRWYGSVYPGYPFILMFGVLAGYPWMINPLISMLTALVFYRFICRFFNPTLAKLSLISLFLSPFYRMMSAIHMSHAAATLWTLLSIWSLWGWIKDGNEQVYKYSISSGLFIGMLYITRPQAAAVLLSPFLATLLFRIWSGKLNKKALIPFTLVLIIFQVFLGFYNSRLTGDSGTNPRYYVDPGRRLGFGSEIGEPLAGGARSGHTFTKGLKNVLTLAILWNSDMFGVGAWGVLGLCSLGLLSSILCKPFRWLEILLSVGIFLNFALYVFYFTPSPNFGPRYLAEAIPSTIILCMCGLQKIIVKSDDNELSERKTFSLLFSTMLIVVSIAVSLPIHTLHYGNLPQMLDRSKISQINSERSSVVLVPPHLYSINVFSWNSPNLEGMIFVRESSKDVIEKVKISFPTYDLYRLKNKMGIDGKYQLVDLKTVDGRYSKEIDR